MRMGPDAVIGARAIEVDSLSAHVAASVVKQPTKAKPKTAAEDAEDRGDALASVTWPVGRPHYSAASAALSRHAP